MAVPYVFANATSAIPLSNLDNNFSTPVTIGNVAIQLGNTATTLGNVTMANVTITSVSTPITGAQGGTGLSSYTANAVVYAPTTSTLATGSALTFNGTDLSTTGNYLLNNNKYIGFKNTSSSVSCSIFQDTSNDFWFYNGGATNTIFYTNATERMRITSSGNLFVGTTSQLINESTLSLLSSGNTMTVKTTGGAGTVPMLCWNNAASGTINLINFFYGASVTGGGTITTNGTITTLNNPSDYRLKNVTGNLTTSSTFINSLKPYVGTYKVNGSPFVGFLAHEVAEISPSSVQGDKDAVDENGDPIYQSLAYSSPELVTNMVAYIQELSEKITSLTDRITALEAK
jgi:hypothetical protein